MWSVSAALHPVSHNPYRVSNYLQYKQSLDWSMLVFPTPLAQIPKFEKANNISINVFDYEKGEIYPRQITEFRFETHVNLLLFTDGEKILFCLIKSLSRVLGDRTKHDGQTYYCNYCLHGYYRQDLLDDHIKNCSINEPQQVEMPEERDKWLKFKMITRVYLFSPTRD